MANILSAVPALIVIEMFTEISIIFSRTLSARL